MNDKKLQTFDVDVAVVKWIRVRSTASSKEDAEASCSRLLANDGYEVVRAEAHIVDEGR
jgi:hypothetical protein